MATSKISIEALISVGQLEIVDATKLKDPNARAHLIMIIEKNWDHEYIDFGWAIYRNSGEQN